MKNKIIITGGLFVSVVSLFVPYAQVFAATVAVTDTCTVQTSFVATVPDSVEQGKSLTVSGIAVTPSSSYGVTVISAIFDMTATNTSSATYSQNFTSTNPSPTTGHNNYTAYHPNWSLVATGPVGSSVVITLKSISAQVQGFGTQNCTLSKTLASIPIVASVASPSPSPSPSPSSHPSSSPSPSSSAAPSKSPAAASTTPTPSPSSSSDSNQAKTSATSAPSSEQTPTVVAVNVDVKDNSGNKVKGATVTLDGLQTMTTDSSGTVIFPNVLTGNHVVLVSYKGQNISHSFGLGVQNVGTTVSIKLPANPVLMNPLVVTGASVATVGVGGGIALLLIKRRKTAVDPVPESAVSLHKIINGSVVEGTSARTTTPIPAISVFESRPSQPAPAPWEPTPTPTPTPAPITQSSVPAPDPPEQPVLPEADPPSPVSP